MIKNNIESLLFISHKPLTLKELAKAVGGSVEETTKVLDELQKDYEERGGGIQMLKLENKYQFASASESSEAVARFIKSEMTGELTRPSLETLTIIAYRAPISKAELEMIRGVNCSVILRNLLMRGLVRAEEDTKKGNIYYSITMDFLKHLGLSKPEDLPNFEALNRDNNLDKLLEAGSNIK